MIITSLSLISATDWVAVFSALAALISVWIAWKSHLLTASLQAPDVSVRAAHDSFRPTVFILLIENHGRQPAYDVQFEFKGRIPGKAWGVDKESADVSETFDARLLREGIPVLPGGDQRVIDWGQFGGLTKSIGYETVQVVVTFKDSRGGHHKRISMLEIGSFEGTTAAARHPVLQLKQLLQKELGEIKQAIRDLKPRQ